MTNPQVILQSLDSYLVSETRLVLYGRAALSLGFAGALAEFGTTMDVDAILPSVEMEKIEADDGFWDALEKVNLELEGAGFYMTHLFTDEQVILSSNWLENIEPINYQLKHLRLFRPSTVDLILSKMMRVDPQDRADIIFLLGRSDLKQKVLENCLQGAVVPPIEEIREAFEVNREWLLDQLG